MTRRTAAVISIVLLVSASCARQAAVVTPRPQNAATAVDADVNPSRQWLEMFARGYFPGRSGQLFFVPHEGDYIVDKDPLYRFMHGSPWPYDTQIPLLLHGPAFVRTGTFAERVVQQDVAPTLAAALGAYAPPTTSGRVLREALLNTTERPRIVALIVLDGMRADYWSTYADAMPTLVRLRGEGAWFSNAHANSMPTATSIGHATLGTGADPRVHGVVVNQLFNRVTGKPQESYNALDPGELMALTLSDVWSIATEGRAIIIGQGGAIRAVAGLVGHGSCMINGRPVIAASYSARTGGWETNETCYKMPAALAALNGERYWNEANGTWRGHDIASARTLRASAVFQRFEGEALTAVLESQAIGRDEVTDLVLVNMKGPDYVSHAYGPSSPEMRETLAELDRQLARAIDVLGKKAGANGLLLTITADHGMPPEPSTPRRRITVSEVVSALDKEFAAGGASIVEYFGDPANAQIHMSEGRLRELGVSLDAAAAFLRKSFFAAVFTQDEVRRASEALPLGK